MSSGVAVVTNAVFPDTCINFGDIVAQDNLVYGLRASNIDNLIDLSNGADANIQNGTLGFASDGVNNGDGTAYIQTAVDNKAADEFTMLVTCKLSLNSQSSINAWVGGNYVDSSTGGFGLYFRGESDPNNAGKFRVIARGSMTRRRLSDNVYGAALVDAIIVDNLSAYTDLGWMVFAYRFKVSDRQMAVKNMLTGVEVIHATTDVNWINYNMSGAGRNGTPSSVPSMRIMSSASSLITPNVLTMPEFLYWDKALTDAELAEQLNYTRAFMQNVRGVTLP